MSTAPILLAGIATALLALHPVAALVAAAAAVLFFVALFMGTSVIFRLAMSALGAFSAFMGALSYERPETAAALCCTVAIAFGDVAAPAVGLFANSCTNFGGALSCASGIVAGAASMGLREMNRRRDQQEKIRRLQSYAVQNAFITVKE